MARKFDVINEQIVLMAMVESPALLKIGLNVLTEDDFIGERHRVIFSGIKTAVERGFEVISKNIALFSNGQDFGGMDYLEELFAKKYSVANQKEFAYHLEMLTKDGVRFRASKDIKKFENLMLDKSKSFEECERELASLLSGFRASNVSKTAPSVEIIDDWLKDFSEMRAGKKIVFRSTGMEALDGVLKEGFASGGVTILAGRPRMGKSVLWTDLIRRMLIPESRPKILAIPFEKGKKYFLNMLISGISQVDLGNIIKDTQNLTDSEEIAVRKAAKWVRARIADRTLTVMDSPVINQMLVDEHWNNKKAMDSIEKIIAEGDYDVVFFDLLERILATNLDSQQIALALIRAQSFSPKYNIHQVITQQLRRSAEDFQRTGKRRPALTDLKNSGAYEEIPDQILLIHREKVYKPLLNRDEIELKLAKQKLGEDGVTIIGDFKPAICRIVNDRIQKASDVIGSKSEVN